MSDSKNEPVKKKKTGGLAGVIAGKTAICTVGKAGKGLNYRGYSIYDLAENATFEEVAHTAASWAPTESIGIRSV